MALALLVAAALCYSLGGYFMKLSHALTHLRPSLALFALFLLGAALQTLAMRDSPMGTTYILVLGLEAVAALALGIAFLGERLTASAVAGVILVIAGVILLRGGTIEQ